MCDNFILRKAEAWEPMKFIRGAARLSVRHWQSREPLAPAKSRVSSHRSTSCEQLYQQPVEDTGPFAMRKAPSTDRVKQTEHKPLFKLLGNSRSKKNSDIQESNFRRSVLNFRKNESPSSKNIHEKYIPLKRASSPPEHIYSEPKQWNSQYDECCRPPVYQSVEKKAAANKEAADKKIYTNRPPCYDELTERLSHDKTRKANIPLTEGGLANKITQNNNKVVIYFGDSIIRKHTEQKKEENRQKEITNQKEEAIYVNRQIVESENLEPNKDVDKGGGTQLVSEVEVPEAIYSEIKTEDLKETHDIVTVNDATYKKDIFESVSPDGFLVVEFEGNFERARQLVELVHGGRVDHNEATVLDEDDQCDWSFIQDWRKRPSSGCRPSEEGAWCASVSGALHSNYTVNILEETPQTLYFDQEFGFHDKDLGQHAQYKVHLESVYPPGAAEAFFIQPEVGYQRQTFIMGTSNHSMLDFEIPEFQHIELKVVATDMDKPEFVGVATVFINLINWNDELPIFENSIQTVKFKETEGEGFFVAGVQARDRDIGDKVVHSIMGTAQNILRINEDTGDIYVAADEAFDYHRQNELLVQVRAEDTLGEPYNVATSQLVIQLEDVNNTPPTLRLPRGTPQVEENVPQGFPIIQESQNITATDPDTTADLRFEIIWDTSYATKQGRETDSSHFYGCVEIETVYPNPNERGVAVGMLSVKEIRPNVTIDYEEFEVLYLSVRVVDSNTEIGQNYDELTYTITIVDMNDNAPQWVSGSLTQELRVRENSATNTIIGSVQATDIDGPLYNQVRYTIRPKEGTPDDLVKIDFRSGQIEVDRDGAIDADTPPRYNLYYTVVASDKCSEEDDSDCPPDITYWETEGDISIQIIDTNNKNPMARTDRFNTTVYLYENAKSGDEVVLIKSEDLDRDEMYNTVSYQINYAVNQRLRDFFAVDLDSGRVYVDLTTDESLDRDGDEPTHRIFLTLIDNFYSEGDGNRNQNTTEIEVILLDINDNAPELPSRDQLSWSISENFKEGEKLSPYIHARDRDEPNTDNSRVGYEIRDLAITNRDITIPDLFEIVHIFQSGNFYNVSAELEATMDLRGYWGTYNIAIRAFDHGDPPLHSEEKYELIVRPYNFHAPVFVFPKDGTSIRLARERAVSNGLLVLVTGDFLDRIQATDEDGLHAGTLSFEITGDDAASEYFQIVSDGENQGTLILRELFAETIREFQIRIRATDGGTEPGPLFTEVVLSVVFVPTQGEPTFQTNTVTVAFVEKEVGLTEENELPLAEDPKNYLCNDDCHEIFYRIISGNDEGYFALDSVKNILSLNKELDRSESETHVLQIAASNSKEGTTPLGSSILTVTVTVREANPRPYFVRKLYTAGISTLDTINRELLTVQATHSEGLPIVYTLNLASMVTDPSLSNVRESAFTLHNTTGVLTLSIQPTASMHGMFEFDVVATDPLEAHDTAAVKIYLISSLNRVFIIFVNNLQLVETHRDFIEQTFSTGFNMTCNIDQVLPATDSAGVVRDDLVEVRAHFIRDDVPVPTDVIEDIRSDTQLLRAIQTTLNTELLVLRDFVTDASPDLLESSTALYAAYALAALSALLGLLCLVLLAAYIIRTRALNRRLQALSMTKYGSQESGLNRLVLAAPGTNKHATEGSNPIWNEAIKAPDFDAISEQSDDSDLIGIENLPQFRSDYFPPADSNSIQEMSNDILDPPLAAHNNNFGFNPTPFTPEFANRPFRHK